MPKGLETERILKKDVNQSLLDMNHYKAVVEKYDFMVNSFVEAFDPQEKEELQEKSRQLLEQAEKIGADQPRTDNRSGDSIGQDSELESELRADLDNVILRVSELKTSIRGDYEHNTSVLSEDSLDVLDDDVLVEADGFIFDSLGSASLEYSSLAGAETILGEAGDYNALGFGGEYASDIADVLDSSLLGVIADGMEFVKNAIELIENIGNILNTVGNAIGGGDLGGLLNVGFLKEVKDAIDSATELVGDAEDLLDDIEDIVDGGISVDDIIGDIDWGSVGDDIGDIDLGDISPILGDIKDFLIEVKDHVDDMIDAVEQIYIEPVTYWKGKINENIRDANREVKEEIDLEIGDITDSLTSEINSLTGFDAAGHISDAHEVATQVDNKISNYFKSIKTDIASSFDPIIDRAKEDVKAEFEGLLDPVKEKVHQAIEDYIANLTGMLSFNFLGSSGKAQLKGMIGDVAGKVANLFDGLVDKAWDKVEGVFNYIEAKIDDQFDMLFENSINLLEDEFDTMIANVINQINNGDITTKSELLDSLKDGYTDSLFNVLNTNQNEITGLINDIYSFLDTEFLSVLEETIGALDEVNEILEIAIGVLDVLDGAEDPNSFSLDLDDGDDGKPDLVDIDDFIDSGNLPPDLGNYLKSIDFKNIDLGINFDELTGHFNEDMLL